MGMKCPLVEIMGTLCVIVFIYGQTALKHKEKEMSRENQVLLTAKENQSPLGFNQNPHVEHFL